MHIGAHYEKAARTKTRVSRAALGVFPVSARRSPKVANETITVRASGRKTELISVPSRLLASIASGGNMAMPTTNKYERASLFRIGHLPRSDVQLDKPALMIREQFR